MHSHALETIGKLNEKSSEFLSPFKERLFNIIHSFGEKPLFLRRPFKEIGALDSGAPNFFESAKNEMEKIENFISSKALLVIHIDFIAKSLSNDFGTLREVDILSLLSIKSINKKFQSLFEGNSENLSEGIDENKFSPHEHLMKRYAT